MTPRQRKMARHALGLDVLERSYRNRYAAGLGSEQESEWDQLVAKGLASRHLDGVSLAYFSLTHAGARAALDPGETLDSEDFPFDFADAVSAAGEMK